MIVSEFIEWLKTQDQGAIVEVVCELEPSFYESNGGCKVSEFKAINYDQFEYIDLRGNPYVKPDDSLLDKRFLLLGYRR